MSSMESQIQGLTNLMKKAADAAAVETAQKNLQQKIANKKRGNVNMSGLIQWSIRGGAYVPEGHIQLSDRMDPGQYKIVSLGMGTVGFGRVSPVNDELIRVPDSATDLVLSEIDNFWGLSDKYATYGMSHKRGFLLYGPPGSGKTSTVNQVAESIVANDGIVVHSSNPSALPGMLSALRSIEPDRKVVVVMEDIDNAIDNGDEDDLLSLLDGQYQIDKVVYIATTNYLKRLPPRIRNRPSRFDRLVQIGKPSASYRKAYIVSRNTGLSDAAIDAWTADTDGLSIAHIKEIIVGVKCLGLHYSDVLGRVRGMAEEAEKEQARMEGEDN